MAQDCSKYPVHAQLFQPSSSEKDRVARMWASRLIQS